MVKRTKNPAAVALGRRRWLRTTRAQRSAAGRRAALARLESMTPEEIRDHCRRMAAARKRKK